MAEQNPNPVDVMLSAFQIFLGNAATAQQKRDRHARDIWLQAASQLFATDDHSLSLLIQQLAEQKRANEGEAIARAFTALRPKNAAALFRHGLALQYLNRHKEAIAPYRAAYAIDPDLYSLRNNLAAALIETDPTSREAEELLRAALEKEPADANGWLNLGKLYLTRFDLASSLEASERALQLQPDNAVVLSNHGQRLREAQRWDDAERCAARAYRVAPDVPSYLSNLSMIHLLRGNYADGWREHEARWFGSRELAGKRPVFPRPSWQGESLAGKTLLLWGEQGMGDLLQFCRYVPMLAERVHREGGRLVWNSFPQMGGLLSRTLAQYADELTLGGGVEHLPKFDYEIGMVSLPLVFQTREETIPADVPYLRADPDAVRKWRERLSSERRLKVGLVWTGSHTHQRNPFRRVGLERYVDYFRDLGNVAFYSLQPGAGAEVASARSVGFDIVDHTGEFKTFDDTATFIESLDLVISVCTSVAHLSGALGQRTWVLLDVNPHWMWLLDRADSPWYPTATLYRQKEFAQWEPVFDQLQGDLKALAAEHSRKA